MGLLIRDRQEEAGTAKHHDESVAPLPTAQYSTTQADVKSGLQLARKLYIFPSSSKVNPLGSSDEKLRSLSRHLPDASASSEAMPQQQCAQAPWADLPESVVEKVFRILKADQQKSDSKGFPVSSEEAQKDQKVLLAHNLSGVCKTWRRAASFVFLSNWWHEGKINHPKQCLLLTPTVFPYLLRCFVERAETPYGACFTLYQGERHRRDLAKFLMAADLGRFGVTLTFSKKKGSPPCGRISSNLLCTKYGFTVNAYIPELTAGAAAKGPPSLASVEYRTRLQGCMRPRRMRVSIPGRNLMTEAISDGSSASDQPHKSALDSPPGLAPVSQEDVTLAISHGQKTGSNLQKTLEKHDAILTRQRRQLKLENKTPHWNGILNCWCLNFRGRVKFASVKNFQLVDVEERDEIVMQFGKVAQDIYILDFQPASISVAQAFAVALSAFNKGLCPY